MATRAQLIRRCGAGDQFACAAARLYVISAGSVVTFRDVDAEDSDHPNKMPFKGVLLVVDEPSTKPPHGSQGHRIYVPTDVAKKRLDGLIGMAVNYDKVDLDGHASRHKVGVITKAWLSGKQVWVEGFIYKKDFPEAVKDLRNKTDLGMSMELAEVYVRDADEHIWHLQDFQFTGATILKKNAAAYYKTALAAQAAAASRRREEMANPKKKVTAAAGGKIDAGALTLAVGNTVKRMLTPIVTELKASRKRQKEISDDLEEMKSAMVLQAAGEVDEDIDAAAREDDEDAASHEDDEDAAHEDDEDAASEEDDEDAASDEDDEDAAADNKNKDDGADEEDDSQGDSEDDDELDAMEDLEEESVEEEPGQVNKKRGDKNKGRKTSVTDPPRQGEKVSGNIAKGRLSSAARPFPKLKSASMHAAAVRVSELTAALQTERKSRRLLEVKAARLEQSVKKQKRLITKINAQMDRYADQESRRSAISPDLRNLAAKANVDLYELRANGEKMTVAQVDAIFAAGQDSGLMLDPETRMGMKNRLLELGLMEQGEEQRSWQN